MAEFKLGRIRFVWKGEWSYPRTYYKDDVVRLGGKTYICLIGHEASTLFNTDLTANDPRWEQMSDGVAWRGDWAPQSVYILNDIVKYGGQLYIANQGHTSDNDFIGGLENELGTDSSNPKWDLFAEGFDYKADWTQNTRYKLNDIVKYGARLYICTEYHVSASTVDGLEVDSAKWEVFSEGFDWLNAWQPSYRYRQNDTVKYGGQIYVCNEGHTSSANTTLGLEDDQSKWDYLHKGIEFLGQWLPSYRYKVNDVVKDSGALWICTTHHTSSTHDTLRLDEANWSVFVPGLEFEDSWSATREYQPGDVVTFGGYSYVATTNNVSKKPTENTNDWQLFLTGFNLRGDYGEDSSNQDYRTGDVVRLGGFTYLAIADSNGVRPPDTSYWEKLNSGIYWKDAWADGSYYDQGDVVRYGVNSYICILEHTADDDPLGGNNRPDQDISGTNWKLLSAGAESGSLTTIGDLVYYSGSGPTRLPVGEPGQVLVVNSDATGPEWKFFGFTNHVYYVSVSGVDEVPPKRGITVDRPYKTVRFACEQIEKGAAYTNAKNLLTLNRSFIQAEIVEWVDYQITNNISPFTTGFTYDKEKCRRDMGQLVDAAIWDISHGGNVRSRNAALAYFTPLGASYVAGQEDETVAAINYGVEVIDAVLTNTAPTANYQVLNSVGSPISQQIDSLYTEEADAQQIVENLLAITTDAITAGDTDDVPAQVVAQKSVIVKTGEYFEVSPIVVPENTAIIGEELRSTRIGLSPSVVSSSDTTYSLESIARIRDIVSNVITNTAVTVTTGNTTPQVVTRPSGSAAAGVDASGLFQEIYDYVDYSVNGATGDSTVPKMRGSNTPETSTDYTYAVETLKANVDFIIAEVHAYIADAYPSYTYDLDACARDVREYIDAVAYDLIYTGNYKSLSAARIYGNSVNGSRQADLFYMRNGTGLRNCTLFNASGNLGSTNEYGTRRPTAGAYTSLDPGWGPDHIEAWVKNKSPYIQNVTTFGDGCVGCKVDGALHNGGNDSIVANDFTQIVSDGIGYWVTNLGRAELVSVFCYYNHIGYLCETGGKIRATNGNNSYGDFGSVAEGIDATETPVLGEVDNQQLEAQIGAVLTDGSNRVLQLEYTNAGQGYTKTATAIKSLVTTEPADEFRTEGTYKGVVGTSSGSGTGQEFTIDVSDVGAVSIAEVTKGGTGHAQNDVITVAASEIGGTGDGFDVTVSQIGDATQFVISGEGFGTSYTDFDLRNGGVKTVRILKDDLNDVIFGGEGYKTIANNAQSGTTTAITISATDTQPSGTYDGMAVYLTAGKGAGQYAYIDTFNGATKEATVRKMSDGTPGWDHVLGEAIETSLDTTTGYTIEPRVVFSDPPSGITAVGRARVADDQVVEVRIIEPGSGYTSAPTITITDPNATQTVSTEVLIADGVLGQLTFDNRGTGFVTASASVTGDGFSDIQQYGTKIRVDGLDDVPLPGSNVEFASIPNKWYKLVTITSLIGNGPYSAIIQVSPEIDLEETPPQGDGITIRRRYSQVRLTGHDFLDIGTGNFANTNYPGEPLQDPVATRETNDFGGGRVFYTSTDQDGNFRVGGLFNVEQATGIATLNVEAFNISGLNELQLGSVALGGTGAVITEFSTDGTFAANSDSIVPTQKAIKTYITAQIGGGAATLNVNSLTAGVVEITGQQISTTDGSVLEINSNIKFNKAVDGAPVAYQMFLLN